MKNNFCIISYATSGTPYVEVLHDYLEKSVYKFQLSYATKTVPNLGTWQLNTSYKPKFILEMMNELENIYDSVAFIDADAEILKYPTLFEEIPQEYDIAAHRLNHDSWYRNGSHQKELLSGTLWLRINDKVKQIVKEWYENAIKNAEWEQKTLDKVLQKHPEIKFYELPLSYIYIKTLPNGLEPFIKIKEPFIIHNQVSRKLRKWLQLQKYNINK